jgi:hypothetical protein
MLFSGMRWLYTLILDVLLRSGFGLAVKLVPFYAFYVLPLSLIHVASLAVARPDRPSEISASDATGLFAGVQEGG